MAPKIVNLSSSGFSEKMFDAGVLFAVALQAAQNIGAPPRDPSKPVATDKASIVKMLNQSFDYVIEVLPTITSQQLKRTWHVPSWQGRTDPDGRAMILNMLVHTAHHRAQCEVYLRVKGIKPPDYRF